MNDFLDSNHRVKFDYTLPKIRDFAVSIYNDVETWETSKMKQKSQEYGPSADYARFKKKYIVYLEKLTGGRRQPDWTEPAQFKKLLRFIKNESNAGPTELFQ